MATVLKLNGIEVNRAESRIRLDSLVAYSRGDTPKLSFMRYGVDLGSLPYIGEGDLVDLEVDGYWVFRGDIRTVTPRKSNDRRWEIAYHAEGIRARMDRFGVTDDSDGTDSVTFNRQSTDSLWLPSRAGRTVGQAILMTLQMAPNQAAMAEHGISAAGSGFGATARASRSGYKVSGITVESPGVGYDPQNPPIVLIAGGEGYGATATATVDGSGGIASINLTSGGNGYLSTPEVIISTLPTVTASDLAKLDIIPPTPITIGGDRFGQAIDGVLQSWYPNHFMHVEPDGTLRFLDQRAFGAVEIKVHGNGHGALIHPVIDPVTGAITDAQVVHGGTGYTSATAEVIAEEGDGGSISLTVEGGQVVAASVASGGNGYHSGATWRLLHGLHPVEAPQWSRSWSDGYSRVQVRGGPYVEGTILTLGRGDLEEAFEHSGLTNAEAKANHDPRENITPSQGYGTAEARAILEKAAVDKVEVLDVGSGFTSAPKLKWSGGGGTSLSLTATVSQGRITKVEVDSSSADFSFPPEITIDDDDNGGGWGARFRAVLKGRPIDSIQVYNGGYGYEESDPPAVNIRGGEGSGATIDEVTVSGSGQVTAIELDNKGSGYRSPPRVVIGSPFGPSRDTGSIVTVSDLQTIVVESDDRTKIWPGGHWDHSSSGRHAVMVLIESEADGIQRTFQTRVVANTPLSAGGQCEFTVDPPLPHTRFDSYEVIGQSGGSAAVYRRYRVTDEAIASAMTNRKFTTGFPLHGVAGGVGSMTWFNSGQILWSPSGQPPYLTLPAPFVIDPDAGTITFESPTYTLFGDPAKLRAGQIDGIPDDISVVVGINKPSLRAEYPEDDPAGNPVFDGELFDRYGVQETLTITIGSWQHMVGIDSMRKLAQEWHGASSQVAVDGQTIWLGSLPRSILAPGLALGVMGWNGDTYDLGMNDEPIPVTEVQVHWGHQGSDLPVRVTMSVSNRRQPLSSAIVAIEPSVSNPSASFGDSFSASREGDLVGGGSWSRVPGVERPNIRPVTARVPGVSRPSSGMPSVDRPSMRGRQRGIDPELWRALWGS